MRLLIIGLITFVTLALDISIEGKWKIVSFGTIDNIKSSPGYLLASEAERALIDEQFELILEQGSYQFTNDTLTYTDIEYGQLIYRQALYSVKNDTLTMTEINRPYIRQAIISLNTSDSLKLVPIVDGKAGSRPIVFARVTN